MFCFNKKYILYFSILFVIEALIALFVHDDFIRPYIGDMIVVVLLYFFVKSFISKPPKFLILYIFMFAASIEICQYFNIVKLLGLEGNGMARIVIGSTFDFMDILCYMAGCIGVFLF